MLPTHWTVPIEWLKGASTTHRFGSHIDSIHLRTNNFLPSPSPSDLTNRQLWSPYLGILVNSGLVTLLLSEVVKYFRTFRRDKPILKATVVALTIVELTQW